MNKENRENFEKLWNKYVEWTPATIRSEYSKDSKQWLKVLKKALDEVLKEEPSTVSDKNPTKAEVPEDLSSVHNLEKVYESLEEDTDNPKIDNPCHYQSYNNSINIDCITAMRAAFGDWEVAIFCKLNAFKYNWRAESKGKNTDIAKMVWYGNKYLELNKE